MWKKLIAILSVVVVCSLLIWNYAKPEKPLLVKTIQPVNDTIETTLDLKGVVVNSRTVNITALIDGKISQISVREGQHTKAQQTMAFLDSTTAETLLKKANAELRYSRQKSENTYRNYYRLETMSKNGNVSKQTLENARDSMNSADAETTIAETNVALAQIALDNATVKAPFDGVVIKQHAETGQWVEAGTPLFDLVADEGFLIEAEVDASDWSRVSIDQTVFISAESSPDKEWQSNVSWIAPTISRNRRNAKVIAIRFEFGIDAPQLLLDQEVDVELVLDRVDNVLSLPLAAMIEHSPGEYSVFVARDGRAVRAPVTVGLQNAITAEVTEGLSTNDNVILRPSYLEENALIEIQ